MRKSGLFGNGATIQALSILQLAHDHINLQLLYLRTDKMAKEFIRIL